VCGEEASKPKPRQIDGCEASTDRGAERSWCCTGQSETNERQTTMKTDHAERQARMWGTASPSESTNPDFYLRNEGRIRAPLTFDTTNFGNGTNHAYKAPETPWYKSL
jgi:hypothetical protein